jgi:hypothetical protein
LTLALAHQNIVTQKLSKELVAGRIAGPFHVMPFHPFRVSPLGLVPKKSPGEFRLIHHLSFPRGLSVNDGIGSEDTSVHYATVADAICLIKSMGRAVLLRKQTLKMRSVLFLFDQRTTIYWV